MRRARTPARAAFSRHKVTTTLDGIEGCRLCSAVLLSSPKTSAKIIVLASLVGDGELLTVPGNLLLDNITVSDGRSCTIR